MNIHTHILGPTHSLWFIPPSATLAMLCGSSYNQASIQNLRVFTEVVLQVMTRCSLMGGYQRIGKLTMSIFSNLKYSSTTTQHTTCPSTSYLIFSHGPPSFCTSIITPWTTFLFVPCIFLLSCTFNMFFRIYLLIHSFFKHAYTPLFCSKVFISVFSAFCRFFIFYYSVLLMFYSSCSLLLFFILYFIHS